MPDGTRNGDGKALPNDVVSTVDSVDSGVWARPGAAVPRPQEGPLGGTARLPPWAGWCAAIAFCVTLAAIVLGTLLQLTRELVELGHPDPRAIVDER